MSSYSSHVVYNIFQKEFLTNKLAAYGSIDDRDLPLLGFGLTTISFLYHQYVSNSKISNEKRKINQVDKYSSPTTVASANNSDSQNNQTMVLIENIPTGKTHDTDNIESNFSRRRGKNDPYISGYDLFLAKQEIIKAYALITMGHHPHDGIRSDRSKNSCNGSLLPWEARKKSDGSIYRRNRHITGRHQRRHTRKGYQRDYNILFKETKNITNDVSRTPQSFESINCKFQVLESGALLPGVDQSHSSIPTDECNEINHSEVALVDSLLSSPSAEPAFCREECLDHGSTDLIDTVNKVEFNRSEVESWLHHPMTWMNIQDGVCVATQTERSDIFAPSSSIVPLCGASSSEGEETHTSERPLYSHISSDENINDELLTMQHELAKLQGEMVQYQRLIQQQRMFVLSLCDTFALSPPDHGLLNEVLTHELIAVKCSERGTQDKCQLDVSMVNEAHRLVSSVLDQEDYSTIATSASNHQNFPPQEMMTGYDGTLILSTPNDVSKEKKLSTHRSEEVLQFMSSIRHPISPLSHLLQPSKRDSFNYEPSLHAESTRTSRHYPNQNSQPGSYKGKSSEKQHKSEGNSILKYPLSTPSRGTTHGALYRYEPPKYSPNTSSESLGYSLHSTPSSLRTHSNNDSDHNTHYHPHPSLV